MMKINLTESYKSLAKLMSDYAEKDVHTEAYMSYDDATNMIAEFIKSGHKLYSIDICNPEMDDYYNPYSVSVINDNEKKLFIERCYCGDIAVRSDCDILFTIGEVNKELIDACGNAAIHANVEIVEQKKDENEYCATRVKEDPVRTIYAHLVF